MNDKKAIVDDDVSGDVLKLMEREGPRIIMQLIHNICETGEWPKDFIEVTMIALKKNPYATKCSDHSTICLITCIAKIMASIRRRWIERQSEDVLGEYQFGFGRGKGTRDRIRMLRIISE
jgi:hypothetical protein